MRGRGCHTLGPPLHIEVEIKKFARRNRKLTKLHRAEEMAKQEKENPQGDGVVEETLEGYFSPTMGVTDSICHPRV